MKSLVTGGAGFIGSNLVDHLLSKGHEVIVLDNFYTGKKKNLSHNLKKNLKVIKVDISKNKKLDKYFKDVNYVFHLAALANFIQSIKYPKKFYKVNVIGTLNILKAAKKAKIKKFIYAASASFYGTPKKFPTSEKAKIKLPHPYASTKWRAEKLIMRWSKIYKLPSISLRLFNVYGPRINTLDGYKSVFGFFIDQKLKKKPLTIIGDGNQTRDFIHVQDTASAMLKSALSKKEGKIYNVGFGKETKINYIAKLFGGKIKYISPKYLETKRSLADINKIKKELKWKPKISIEKGVKKFLNFYSK